MATKQTLDESVGAVALADVAPDGIDLWLVDLDRYAATVAIEGLDAAEMDRAGAFRFDRDRLRYTAGRHALRRLLATTLGMDPAKVPLVVDAFGKPTLAAEVGRLHFNVSHSGHLALIALSPGAAVGVDLELALPVADAEALADAHFTAEERIALSAAPAASRDRLFLQAWTRKEACLKAAGVGLTVDARHVHAGCDAGCRKVAIPIEGGAVETTVRTLETGAIPDTIAAVAQVTADARISAALSSTAT